jgi:hypothetical protein
MASFPVLDTNAVTQYPAAISTGQAVQVIRFLDAADQRYLVQPRSYRQWQIRLDLLNESEIQALEAFFVSQSGDYSTFNFPDPFSGSSVPNCRLGAPGFISEYVGVDVSSTSFWVIETNG